MAFIVAVAAVAATPPFPGKPVTKVTREGMPAMKVMPKKVKAEMSAMPMALPKAVKEADVKRNKAPKAGNRPSKVTPLITTPPAGEVKYYKRAGGSYNKKTTPVAQDGIVTVVFCDNNEVYILNPLSGVSAGSYVKGTLDGNRITVDLPQTIYNFTGYNLEVAWLDISAYLDGTASNYYAEYIKADRENTTAVFTIEDDVISLQGSSSSYILAGVYDDDDMWYGGGDYETVWTETALEETVTPPAGVDAEQYYYNGNCYYSSANHAFSSTVNVIKDGNDVYIQGLATGDADRVILPDAWAKGTLNGTTLTIPQGQYMGMNAGDPIYLLGYSGNAVGDITFTYDAEAETFTLDNLLFVNSKKDEISYWTYTQAGAVISKDEPEPVPEPELVVVPASATVETDWSIEAAGSKSVSKATSVAFDGDDVYFQGVAYWFPEAWIKGTISNGVASFPSGQFVGEDDYGQEFVISADGSDIEFSFDAENQVFTLASPYLLESNEASYGNNTSVWEQFTSMKVFKGEIEQPEVIEVPDGLQTETYSWTGKLVTFDDDSQPVYEDFTKFINIGFDGNDVYVQGLCADLSEAWVKGTLNGSTVTFPTGQYFGADERLISWGYVYPHYFIGYGNDIQDVTFTYDAENKVFTGGDEWIIDNEEANSLNYYLIYSDNVWSRFNEVAGTPVTPSILGGSFSGTYPNVQLNIPLETTDGDAMSPAKVFYRLFSDIEGDVEQLAFTPNEYENLTETLYEIPYTFDDDWDIYEGGSRVYLNQSNVKSFNKIGLQVVYYGGDETHESEIVWFVIKGYTPTAIFLNVTDDDEIALSAGQTFQLEVAGATPEGADTQVVWTSSDEAIATVGEYGLVTAQTFDGNAVKAAQAPSDNDGYDYFPVTITATSAAATPVPVSASVVMWVKSSSRTAVNEINATGGKQVTGIYNVNGQRVNKDAGGVLIIRHNDGTTTKVMR